MSRILRQVTVVRDGMHNAFTDLACWQDGYWVSYRKGTAHVSIDSEAVIAVSEDRTRFREVARLKVPGDNRDPKLFPIDEKRIAAIFPSWVCGYKQRNLQSYIAFSEDGFNWSKPQPILDRGQWLWRVRRHEGLYYGLIEGIAPPDSDHRMYVEIVTSTDLLEWNSLSRVGKPEQNLNESDIYFHPDGEAWMVARGMENPNYSYFASARKPYTDWETTRLNSMIHAPIILEHGGQLYVAGRCNPDLDGIASFPYLSRCTLGIWKLTRGHTDLNLLIPASGDCSYPGLVKDPAGRICLSYYSQHAYHSGVIPMPFRLEPDEPHDKGQLLTPNDIYFAELQLD